MTKPNDKTQPLPEDKGSPLAKPSLTPEDLAKVWPENSKGLEQLQQQYSAAKVALEQANAAQLFTLYEASLREQASLSLLFTTTVKNYVGSKGTPQEANAAAVAAMERVALAAIDLAKACAAAGTPRAGA